MMNQVPIKRRGEESGSTHLLQHRAALGAHPLQPAPRDLIRIGSRRWFLQTGLAGCAGLSLVDRLRLQAAAAPASAPLPRAVMLFWLSGGPSQLDMWDPKPHAPQEIRGPYRAISTTVPGIEVCEHLPRQASIMHKLTILRGVDCSASNHTPITMQAGNALARRTDDGRDGGGYPSMGSVAARFRGPNDSQLPAFVGLADSWAADVWGAGNLGRSFEPVKGQDLAGRLATPEGLSIARLQNRNELRRQFDRLRQQVDQRHAMQDLDQCQQAAFDMVLSGKAQRAFDVAREPEHLRDAYGRDSLGEKALLARRLVEAGVTFVVVSGAWGYFDHHGDEVRWGGIVKGLTPILPSVDRVMHTLIEDLESRGLLDSTLVLMLGEFGRTPVMTATGGRGHWTNAMSMLVAGGGLPRGHAIGATDRRGGEIVSGRVRPVDLAALVFRHLQIDLDSHWIDPQGRPMPILTEPHFAIPGLA